MKRAFFKMLYLAIVLRAGVLSAQELLVNGNFSAGDTGFTSDYVSVPSGQNSKQGTYGIRSSSQDFSGTYVHFTDHTTGSGFMMLVDGAPSPTAACWRETVAVATNQGYTFTGWATSSDTNSPATLQFAINGTQIGTNVSLGTNAGVWRHFAATWVSGTNSSAQIAIMDTNTASFGNDFALDDLSFTSNSPITASLFTAVEIDWNSVADVNYQVQYSTVLASNTWINLGGPIVGNGTTNIAFDSTRGQPQKFYRIQILP